MRERLVVCGEATNKASAKGSDLRLALAGNNKNITLKLEDISKRLICPIPDLLVDLLELATYVFCADQATGRGGPAMQGGGAAWRRHFRFVVPVRHPDRWSQPALSEALGSTLSFVSDDTYEFVFEQMTASAELQGYLRFGEDDAGFRADEVALFSGGLDSLAGAVEDLTNHGKRVALVTHRSAPQLFEHQKRLVAELKRRFPQRVLHIPVFITKHGGLCSRDYTQRARSFLFGVLALVVARLLGNSRIRFFENGVVSLNLPIAEQVVGARATRTTHPLFIAKLRGLFSLLDEEPIEVENPFVWRTKAEVVGSIVGNRGGDLIRRTISCSRVFAMTKEHAHCGTCSQCLDRRFGVLGAGAQATDPEEMYGVQLLTGSRNSPQDRTMAESYVRLALDLRRMNDLAFFDRFAGETARVVDCFPGLTPDEVGHRVFDLHRRHAEAVGAVLEAAVTEHRGALIARTLPATCLLVMAVSKGAEPVLGTVRGEDSIQEWASNAEAEAEEENAEAPAGSYRPLELAIDPKTERVVIRDLLRLGGADSRLISTLRGPYDEDLRMKHIPENHQYIAGDKLAALLGNIEDASLRRRISCCRRTVAEAYRRKHGKALPPNALVQNKPGTGYRLNPHIRFVAFTEIDR